MNTLSKAALTIALVFGLSNGTVSAKEVALTHEAELRLASLCKAIAQNDRIALMTQMKRDFISYSRLVEGLTCNGHDPITFAALNSADKTGQLIARKVDVDWQSMVAAVR